MKTQITNWEQHERDDLNMIPKMIDKGFEPEFNRHDIRHERNTPQSPPLEAVSFVKGNFHVWKCIDIRTQIYNWMTSELIDGFYTNHKRIDSLQELFE